MADFNPATMINVTRPAVSLQAVFTGSIAASTGILSVTSYTSGQITSQMTLTTNGYDAVVVTDKLTPQAGEIERWQTYRILAGIDGSVTNGVLTVTNVWRGSLAVLGDLKYLFTTYYASGTRKLSVASVDGNGVGTYSLSSSTGLNISARRMYVHYLAQSSQAITNATFTGVWDWESVSSVLPTTNQSTAIEHIGQAAGSSDKGVYFPPGRYVGPAGLTGVAVYGASSKGTDAQSSVLQSTYTFDLLGTEFPAKSYTDIRLDGIVPGKTKYLKGCYVWLPDLTTTFTGSISGTELTVESLPNSGFIPIGAALSGSGVASCTITGFLTGTPGGMGTYTISASRTASSGTSLTASYNSATPSGRILKDSLASAADYEIVYNVFDVPGMYIPVWVFNPKVCVIRGNEFRRRTGTNSHTIRIEALDGLSQSIEVTHNRLFSQCITGILVGSNRLAPVRNLVMDWNEVHNNTEEAIAIDGFGNDISLCPCICNGRLTSITNDANGRVVISLSEFIYATSTTTRTRATVAWRDFDLTGYVSGDVFTTTAAHSGSTAPGSTLKGPGVPDGTYITEIISRPGIGSAGTLFRLNNSFTLGSSGSPVTVKMADWKKFMFIFSEGTGADGAIVEIYDYDSTNNTVTLDLFRSASLFITGQATWAGIHAGFFGGSCSHNKVTGDAKAGQNSNATYSTGISLYHNVFNFDVGHNEVAGIKDGIRVVGGYMLSTYHVLAYHNSLHDNVVSNAQTGADGVAVVTQYSGIPQRGNRVYSNTLVRANVTLTASADDVVENNILAGDNAKIIRTYPTPILPGTNI